MAGDAMIDVEGGEVLNWSAMRPGLVRFLTRRTGCAATAEDLAQDLWLRLQDKAPGAPVRNPIAYLFRAAANVAFDWRRRENGAALPRAEPPGIVDCADDAPSADRLVQSQETQYLLAAAIAELPPKCREAFLLCRLDGLTMREAGKRMGISERTVENHLARATIHCRRRLVEAGAWP